MFLFNPGNIMAGGVNRVAAVFFVSFAEVGGLVHVLDDLAPADAGVVGAEGNLAFLSAVRNDAHLSASEVIVKKILEPHAFDAEHAPHIIWILSLLRLHA